MIKERGRSTVLSITFLVIMASSIGIAMGKERVDKGNIAQVNCDLSAFDNSLRMIRSIINDVSNKYNGLDIGGISEIRGLTTYSYCVLIPREERIVQLTYEFELGQDCQITIIKIEETAKTPWKK